MIANVSEPYRNSVICSAPYQNFSEAYRRTPGTMGTVRRVDRALAVQLYQPGHRNRYKRRLAFAKYPDAIRNIDHQHQAATMIQSISPSSSMINVIVRVCLVTFIRAV